MKLKFYLPFLFVGIFWVEKTSPKIGSFFNRKSRIKKETCNEIDLDVHTSLNVHNASLDEGESNVLEQTTHVLSQQARQNISKQASQGKILSPFEVLRLAQNDTTVFVDDQKNQFDLKETDSFESIKDILELKNESEQGDIDQESKNDDEGELDYEAYLQDENKDADSIEFHFENADLYNFLHQIEDIFDVTFLIDEIIDPLSKDGKAIKGNKVSFKTQKPLNREEAWNLFVSIMQMSKFAVIPYQQENIYKIVTVESARKSALKTFIGIDPDSLPDSDEMIRYVYFVENTDLNTIIPVVENLVSISGVKPQKLPAHKAFVLIDKAYNIKVLMSIVKELDRISVPESMSILKLRNADAKQVAELYQTLLPKEEASSGRFFAKKQPTAIYFPENTRVIAEPRTNALILLGPEDAIEKIEEFIKKHIDIEIDQAYSPLNVYQLKFADAQTIADIMNDTTRFGESTDAGQAGGVRGPDRYMRPMSFVAEPATNRLIIKGYYEDYLKAVEVIKKLDEPQPQVGIEVLILSVTAIDNKSFGAQIRSKESGGSGILGDNIKFQTSGLFSNKTIQENTDADKGVNRLLGNLLNLVTTAGAGNTIVSLGKDIYGVWGVFQVLKSVTNAEIVSNPFLVATNKTPAHVHLGEERRIRTAIVSGTSTVDSFGQDEAKLKVDVTPLINSDGMIILDLEINLDNFIDTSDQNSANKNVKKIKTSTILSDREVLALGGLIQNRVVTSMSKTPILGNIPLLGWFFKNKQKNYTKDNLLILISPRIIAPYEEKEVVEFTNNHLDDCRGTINQMNAMNQTKDPIQKMFFDSSNEAENQIEKFIFEKNKPSTKKQRMRQAQNSDQMKQGRSRRNSRKKNSQAEQEVETLVIENEALPEFEKNGVDGIENRQIVDATEDLESARLTSVIQNKRANQLRLSDVLSSKKQEVRG